MRLDIEPPRVYLILDREFGSGIDRLIDLGTIYYVESETNNLAIERYKKLHPNRERPLGIVSFSSPFKNSDYAPALPNTLVIVADDIGEPCEVTVLGIGDFEKSMLTIKNAGFGNYREGFYNGSRTIVVMVYPQNRRHRLTFINRGKS